jgi:hypothetical protein
MMSAFEIGILIILGILCIPLAYALMYTITLAWTMIIKDLISFIRKIGKRLKFSD